MGQSMCVGAVSEQAGTFFMGGKNDFFSSSDKDLVSEIRLCFLEDPFHWNNNARNYVQKQSQNSQPWSLDF